MLSEEELYEKIITVYKKYGDNLRLLDSNAYVLCGPHAQNAVEVATKYNMTVEDVLKRYETIEACAAADNYLEHYRGKIDTKGFFSNLICNLSVLNVLYITGLWRNIDSVLKITKRGTITNG